MNLPDGRLERSRVVADPGEALADALDRELTGYARLEPQDALLLDADDSGVIAFRGGVPVAVHHSGAGRGGPAALADLAVPGPYRVELHAVDPDAIDRVDVPEWRVPPGMPAQRLAGDPDLADRTREVAPDDRLRSVASGGGPGRGGEAGTHESTGAGSAGTGPPGRGSGDAGAAETGSGGAGAADAVAAFLEDEQKIDAIREQAREQAREKAEEWGLTDQLDDG